MSSRESLVSLQNVRKSYSEGHGIRVVLDGCDLNINAREFIAITGPSGTGKSTLLNIISGIDTVDGGRVKVDGVEISGLTEGQRTRFRRDRIGLVFQFFNLIPTLTVHENLRLPLELCHKPYDNGTIETWLQKLKLADRRNAYPDQLSGGEQQRVAIIRAAIHQPAIVLADEPTGNLDETVGMAVLKLFSELSDNGTTVIMVTHSASAAGFCDRRIALANGHLQG